MSSTQLNVHGVHNITVQASRIAEVGDPHHPDGLIVTHILLYPSAEDDWPTKIVCFANDSSQPVPVTILEDK